MAIGFVVGKRSERMHRGDVNTISVDETGKFPFHVSLTRQTGTEGKKPNTRAYRNNTTISQKQQQSQNFNPTNVANVNVILQK